MSQPVQIRDSIDEILDLWSKTLGDVDMSALGLILRISRLSVALGEDLQRSLRPFGIGAGEMDVLFSLLNVGAPYEQRPSDISKGCYVTTGATTGRVDRLVKAGLVERVPSPKDRREMLVRLTSDGKKMAQRLKREVATASSIAEILDDMGSHDRLEFVRLLRAFDMRFQQKRGGDLEGAMPLGARL
jgi:DNA-binding MarR family transcriptional regulator